MESDQGSISESESESEDETKDAVQKRIVKKPEDSDSDSEVYLVIMFMCIYSRVNMYVCFGGLGCCGF